MHAATAVAGGYDQLAEQAHILLYSEPSSPLKQSGTAIDKLLMTAVEQADGHAALAVAGPDTVLDRDDTWLKVYLYSRAQSVMGGTSQIQKNIISERGLGMPKEPRPA